MQNSFEEHEIYKISPFVTIFNKLDHYCLQHNLTLKKVYGGQILQVIYERFSESQCVLDLIQDLSSNYPRELLCKIIDDLVEKHLLAKDNKDDLGVYVQLFEKGMQQYQIQHMYFIPTTECNFRCKYCFVEDDSKKLKPVFMSEKVARKGLEVFGQLSQNANNITMTFYGGEPLLNAKVLYKAMYYVRELEERNIFKKHVSMSLLTNGALVDQETAKTLKETETKVSVSIDGPKHLHDLSRLYVEGTTTFDDAIKGFYKLQDAGVSPGISCTISKYNVDSLEEVAEYIAKSLKPSGMGFNILLPLIDSENPVNVSHEYATEQLIKAFQILRKYGIYEDRVMRRVRPYTESKVHLKDCMGVGGQIVLEPSGQIGPCQAYLGLDHYFPLNINNLHDNLTNITSDNIYKNKLFDEWRHRFPFNMKECSQCYAISICGGGCPYAAEVNHGTIWEIDDRVCSQAKKVMEWMIWDTFDHLNSVTEST